MKTTLQEDDLTRRRPHSYRTTWWICWTFCYYVCPNRFHLYHITHIIPFLTLLFFSQVHRPWLLACGCSGPCWSASKGPPCSASNKSKSYYTEYTYLGKDSTHNFDLSLILLTFQSLACPTIQIPLHLWCSCSEQSLPVSDTFLTSDSSTFNLRWGI